MSLVSLRHTLLLNWYRFKWVCDAVILCSELHWNRLVTYFIIRHVWLDFYDILIETYRYSAYHCLMTLPWTIVLPNWLWSYDKVYIYKYIYIYAYILFIYIYIYIYERYIYCVSLAQGNAYNHKKLPNCRSRCPQRTRTAFKQLRLHRQLPIIPRVCSTRHRDGPNIQFQWRV